MKKSLIAISCASAMLISGYALAGDPVAGKARAKTCAACHGADGIASNKTFPNLAGQNEAYLISSMKAYKNGQRKGGMAGVMAAQAGGLSDDDIKNLAAFYSQLNPKP